ncbi:MAG: hypothetical protein ABSE82_14750, partial [Nitrososphaerales archaeon]
MWVKWGRTGQGRAGNERERLGQAMANPFTFYKSPHTVSEHQSNANYWTYAKMDAIDKMQEWESAHP